MPYRLVSTIIASLSIASVFLFSSKYGLGPTVELFFSRYNEFVGAIGDFVKPFVLKILSVFDIHVTLNQHWLHIVILLNLYFLAHVGSALRDKLVSAAYYYAIWGFLLAFTTGVLTGALNLNDDMGNALSFLIPVSAIALFITVNSLRSAILFRPAGTTWRQAFSGPMRHVVRLILFSGLLLFTGFVWRNLWGQRSTADWGLILLIAYAVVLATYRIWINQSWVKGAEEKDKSWWYRARHSRQAHIGWMMLAAVVMAIFYIGLGVGEDLLLTNR